MSRVGRPRKYATKEARNEEYARRARERYAAAREVVRDWEKIPEAEGHRNTPWYRMYYNAKVRAKKGGYPFTITILDVYDMWQSSNTCPVLGIEFDVGIRSHVEGSRTLDKIVPELGYTKDNCWIISQRANRIKNDASLQELELLVHSLRSRIM